MFEWLFKRKKKEDKEELSPALKKEQEEKSEAFWSCFDWYSLGQFSDDDLDEVRNRTPYIWFRLKDSVDLQYALKQYSDCAEWAREHENGLHFLRSKTGIVLNSFDIPEEQESIFSTCHQWSTRLFRSVGYATFEDCETKERYKIHISPSYPGSADDAATYADASLEKIQLFTVK